MPWSPAPSSLFLAGVDALRDVCRLRMEVVGEVEAVPMEAVLLIADAPHDIADGMLDLLTDAGRPIAVLVHDAVAADFAGEDDAIGRGHGLAGDARLRVLDRNRSTIASEIWSATLSGWPSETDSEVNRYELRICEGKSSI